MANQDGEFILRIKYPEAVKVAFRQRAKLLARVIDAMPKKQRSPDYEKYLQTEKTRALIRWLDKLENQFPIHHEGGIFGQQSIDMKLFSRYAKKNSLITTTLSDSEYFRIVALEQNPRSRQTVIADLQTAQLEEYARWLNYLLVHEGKNEYEKWFRYLVLHEVATHDARGRKRDPDTTSGVLPFSANALSRIRDAFTGPVAVVHNAIAILEQSKRNDALRAALSTHKNESSSDTASQLERNDEKLLRKENDKIVKKGKHEATNLLVEFPFSERYKHYLALEQQAKIKVLSISEGWHTVTDIDLLTTLSAGTDWCVAGIRTAHTYLDPKGSQMRVFIKKGRPVIGVYSINGEIKESPRGTLSNQNIAPEFLSELALELDQYDNSDSWQQQVEKARTQGILIAKLTENPGATLSLDDLRCVYELDAVQSFGYQPLQSFLKIKITREETRLIEDVALLWPTLTKEEQLTFISGGRHRIAAVLYTITPEEEVALAKELITPSFRSEASKKTYYIHLLMRNIDFFTRAD